MTILEALTWAEQKIKTTHHEKLCNCHNAKFDAQVLLSYIINKPTAFLFAHANDQLKDLDFDLYANLIKRRTQHEPVAHLIGNAQFFGKTFFVNNHVLVPRPETELMAGIACDCAKPHSILIDIGTGSGIIPITWHLETAKPAIAIDIDAKALAVAKHNANMHQVRDITFYLGDLLQPVLDNKIPQTKHLIITANLPYLPHSRQYEFDPDIHFYEPKHALLSGIDGLQLYDELLQQITANKEKLPEEILLFIEIDPTQKNSATALVKEYGARNIELYEDLSKNPRLIKATI
ncbi:peptide chain release factor N(5)-glutamine methyltransferase [Patescibacteria group bacterium]|nr:peptide chain release factor N(5)-glutamine methyltransferase [Patescibacteria group bacterium]